MKEGNLMERIQDRKRLNRAWQQVRRNAGAAGVDGMTIEDFQSRSKELGPLIGKKLREGNYRFKPAKRVLIPKPDSNKKRKLGIPPVMDRVVATSMALVLDEIFDPEFTGSNFGYRKGKSQHHAIYQMKEIAGEGYEWCASVDLKEFFDEIPHDLILRLLRRRIEDEEFITLVKRALKAGVKIDGEFQKTLKGCPQGSPLSPVISNIVLNELDQVLEIRGHRYCRWADDFVIFLKSERAAKRVMESTTLFLEGKLKLPVNRKKSKVCRIDGVTFLGFRIAGGKVVISAKARKIFKERVRGLTKRNNPKSMNQIVRELNTYLKSWVPYFRIQEWQVALRELDQFIRRRLRSMQLKKWKKPKKFQRIMILRGRNPEEAQKTWVNMRRWASSNRKIVNWVLDLNWFREMGLIFLDDHKPNLRASKA
jgi:RNA-directed DNA polymerase